MKPFIKYSFLAIVALFALANTTSAATISRPMHHNGLVGYWAFDLGKGGLTAYDTSGQANNGTLTGMDAATDWVDGQIAGGLDFDGSDDYVDVPQTASITTDLTNVTVSYWIKTSGNNDNKGILGCLFGENSSANGFMTVDDSGAEDGDPKFFSDIDIGGTSDIRTVTKTAPSGSWLNFIYTYDGAQEVLYLDGVGTVFAKTGTLNTNTECGLFIGRKNTIGAYSDGTIDEVRIYNRALSAAEVTRLFNLGKQKFTTPDNTGLIGHWKFEEGTGTNAGDSSGNGNNGTLTGSMTESDWVSGKRGTALDFDGSDDYIDVGTMSNFGSGMGSNSTTFSAWIKTTKTTQQVLIGTGNTGDNTVLQLNLNRNWDGGGDAEGYIYIRQRDEDALSRVVQAQQDNGFTDGEWHHIVTVWHPNALGEIYLDGVVLSGVSKVAQNADNTANFTFPLTLGALNWRGAIGTNGFWDGTIDDTRLYNRALSATEIEKLFKAGQTKFNTSRNNRLTDGLVGLWSFDGKDMSNNTAFDRSPSGGNDGTLTNGPVRTIGKIGQALDFDGVDDLVSVADADILSPSSEITVSAWIKRNSLTGRQFFVSKGQASSNAATEYWLEIASDNGLIFQLADASSHKLTGATSITDTTTWHHVVGTWDGTTQKLYVDGVQDAVTVTWSGSINNTTYELALGNRSSARDIEFNGVLDEVRIYNRALSADEISQLYNMGR